MLTSVSLPPNVQHQLGIGYTLTAQQYSRRLCATGALSAGCVGWATDILRPELDDVFLLPISIRELLPNHR